MKTYACNATGPSLIMGLLVPDSLTMQCHTGLLLSNSSSPQSEVAAPPPSFALPPAGRRLASANSTGNSSYCIFSFWSASPSVQVSCSISSCGIQPESPNFTCDTTSCHCVNDSTCGNDALVSALVQGVAGPSSVDCTPAGNCSVALSGLPITAITASCMAGECLIPSNDTFHGSQNNNNANVNQGSTVSNLHINPLVAALPAILLTLIVMLVGGFTLTHRGMWNVRLAGPPLLDSCMSSVPQADTETAKNSSEKQTMHTLEFREITVTVPMPPKLAMKKRAALRAKALARSKTSHTFYSQQTMIHKLSKTAFERLGIRTSDDVEVYETNATPAPYDAAIIAAERADLNSAAEFVASLHEGDGPGSWTVVSGCSGYAQAGQVIGILGPSGCGKTTLLGVLAGSSLELGASAEARGSVLIDGMTPTSRQQVAFVPQEDTLLPTLTVTECIRYSALLRLPRDMPLGEVHRRVDAVLSELGLRHVADSPIGGGAGIRGVSGGERRRVTIGMELVTNPGILVLDEPTSGLDSYTALTLVRLLRHLAMGDRVVIASLHQPSKDIFHSLDQVYLMGHGRLLYSGTPGDAESVLAACGVPCPKETAIAEHMLKVASSAEDIRAVLMHQQHGAGSDGASTSAVSNEASPVTATVSSFIQEEEDDEEKSIESGCDLETVTLASGVHVGGHRKEKEKGRMEKNKVGGGGGYRRQGGGAPVTTPPAAGFWRQLAVMFWRSLVDIVRNPTLLVLHVTIATVAGILVGAIFFQLSFTSVGVQNRMGATFFALAFMAFTSLTTVDLLMEERRVVVREIRAGYYSSAPYLLSKLTLDGMMLRVIPAILFWIPFYYMAGLRSGAAYASTYLFTLVAFNCTIGALSMAVTVGSSTAGQASFFMNFTLLFSLAFAGFLVNIDSIPAALRWLHTISPFYYAFEAMMTNELNGQVFQFQYQASPTSPPVQVQGVTGQTFLSTLGFVTTNTTLDLGILDVLYAAFMLLAMSLFIMRLPRQRRRTARLYCMSKLRPSRHSHAL